MKSLLRDPPWGQPWCGKHRCAGRLTLGSTFPGDRGSDSKRESEMHLDLIHPGSSAAGSTLPGSKAAGSCSISYCLNQNVQFSYCNVRCKVMYDSPYGKWHHYFHWELKWSTWIVLIRLKKKDSHSLLSAVSLVGTLLLPAAKGKTACSTFITVSLQREVNGALFYRVVTQIWALNYTFHSRATWNLLASALFRGPVLREGGF